MKIKCKKCLLAELDKDEYIENLIKYIENFPSDKKADKITYENRLEICKQCDNLTDGMCSLCGCFVELRAIKKNMYCPDVPKKW